MTLTFYETRGFTQSLLERFGDDESYRLFQNSLLKNPERGDRIQGTGGLRKTRWSDPRRGKGARGGIRVLYLFVPERQAIILIRAYSKGKQDDLTAEQRKTFAIAAETLRRELLKHE